MYKRPSMMSGPNFKSDYKENENAPRVRFIRKNGRIIPIVGEQKSMKGSEELQHRLNEMKQEVLTSSSAGRSFKETNRGMVHSKGFTNYPSFYRNIKFRNKGDFLSAYSGKGKKADILIQQAHEDLSGGYVSSMSGEAPPSMAYRVATKQSFDNRNVIFRRINGRIVPIRLKDKSSKKASTFNDDVPF
jgi:hypothetical protein